MQGEREERGRERRKRETGREGEERKRQGEREERGSKMLINFLWELLS